MDRNARSHRQQRARRIERRAGSMQAMEFFNVLPSPELIEKSESLMPEEGSGKLGLFRSLGAAFQPGDLVLADALHCNYFLIATLMAGGVDMLFEQHGARAPTSGAADRWAYATMWCAARAGSAGVDDT